MDGLKEVPGSTTVLLTRQPTVRLIPASILQPRLRLVDGDRLITGPAFDLQNISEETASPSERVHVPVNGVIAQRVLYSFEASRHQLNRFNGPDAEHGTYYAGTTLPASIAEIQWHLAHPTGAPHFDRTRTYRAVVADVRGRFLDLRGADTPALTPDPASSYAEGRRIAEIARADWDGIVYPSARHPDGTCVAVFQPKALSDLRLGQMLAFEPRTIDGRVEFGYRNLIPQHLMRDRSMGVTR